MGLSVRENNTASISAVVKTAVGGVQDITSWTFQFRVSAPPDPRTGQPGAVLFDKVSPSQITLDNPTLGQITVHIIPADTAGHVGAWLYELKATDNNGSEYTLDGPHDFTITPTII